MKKCSGMLLILALVGLLIVLSPSPSPPPIPTATPDEPLGHLLPSLPGLPILFPAPRNSTAHLSWSLLRSLLARSDALPSTAAGVLEAADAWRKLTLALAAGQEPRNGSCPAYVAGDASVRRIKIPCGLAEGAAVTVVGVAAVAAGGFRVEMMGAGAEVVVCVNMSFDSTGFVMEQSSWTPDEGWGDWERCPGGGGDAGSSGRSGQQRNLPRTLILVPQHRNAGHV